MPSLYTASNIISYPNETFSVHWLSSERRGSSAIGVKSSSGEICHTFEYKLKNFDLSGCLLPIINGDELIWKMVSDIEISNDINETLWETSTYICIIDNDTLVDMQQWVIKYWIDKNPMYSLISSQMMPSSTCDLFSSNVVAYLTSRESTEKVLIIPPKYSSYYITCDSSTTVDYELQKNEINQYYNTLSMNIIKSDTETTVEYTKRIIDVMNSFETIYVLGYHQSGIIGYWKFHKPVIKSVPRTIKIMRAEKSTSKSQPPVTSPPPVTTSYAFTLNSDNTPLVPFPPGPAPSTSMWMIILAIIIIIIIIMTVIILVYSVDLYT